MRFGTYTHEEDQILVALSAEGLDRPAIAARMDRTVNSIRHRQNRLDIHDRRRHGYFPVPLRGDPIVKALFERLRDSGMKPHQFERKSGVAARTVAEWQSGRCLPSLTNLRACLEALGLTLSLEEMS